MGVLRFDLLELIGSLPSIAVNFRVCDCDIQLVGLNYGRFGTDGCDRVQHALYLFSCTFSMFLLPLLPSSHDGMSGHDEMKAEQTT